MVLTRRRLLQEAQSPSALVLKVHLGLPDTSLAVLPAVSGLFEGMITY